MNTLRDTEHGALDVAAEMTEAWRIGFAPDPFAWTPWNYASDAGRFDGRWDDPDGRFRTLYLGDSLLGVLLEVLARLRADLPLLDELAAIEDNDDCDRDYPTLIGGTVPREWVHRRMSASVRLRGEFVDVRRSRTVATCRARFGALALQLGLPDLDSGALKLSAPRLLTQTISAWFYGALRPPVGGVKFGSRFGDELIMWAVFEQPGEAESGSRCMREESVTPLTGDEPEFEHAMRIHGLIWAD